MRRPIQNGLDQLYGRIDNCKTRENADDKNEDKWTPFWQRGHQDDKSERNLLKSASKKVKLFHSSLDISSNSKRRGKRVTISKSVSVQNGLNHMPPIENGNSNTRRSKMFEKNLTGLSSLALPKIDPDVAIEGERDSRESSATIGVSFELGRNNGAGRSDTDSDSGGEEEVYLSDDDPEVSRKNLEKAGEYIVDHDWILQENLAKEARRMSSVRNQTRIIVPDDDPMEAIQSRLDEVTMMVKPKAEWGNFIDTIEPEQRAKIMKYKEIDHEVIRNERRKNWTPLARFRNAVSTVLLLYRACHPRKRYITDDKADTAPGAIKKLKLNNANKRDLHNINTKSSIGFDVQLSLITQPEHRTESDIKRVTWVLRATKAFKHLFPAQVESQLARLVSYERYDDKRIVAQQGRDPERFYYVMTGKLNKIREYRLLSGIVTRNEGTIDKGTNTDPEEMSHNWPREHHLVTKGSVELLFLEKSDFLDLQHTCKGPPIDFLQTLDLFKEFPCEEFLDSPDAIEFEYYGQDKLIVKDTNRTPWLHVVKTGRVKVVRTQTIIDVQNETKFVNQSTEELGCTRPYSHADAMLGLLAQQRKMKTIMGTVSFPEIQERPELERSVTEYFWNNKGAASGFYSWNNKTPHTGFSPGATGSNIQTHNQTEVNKMLTSKKSMGLVKRNTTVDNETPSKQRKKAKLARAPIIVTPRSGKRYRTGSITLGNINEESETGSERPITVETIQETSTIDRSKDRLSPPDRTDKIEKTSFLPPILNDRNNSSEFVPHGTYLTREKTEADTVYPGGSNKAKKETVHRKAYLQLDVLKPGDIFGLDGVSELFRIMYPLKDGYEGLEHLDPQALASEGPGVTLISDGAEIIKISKRFFLSHAQNNTMLKVETMQREYMTAEEAKTIMYDKETWNQYKTVLLQRTVGGLHRNQNEKVL